MRCIHEQRLRLPRRVEVSQGSFSEPSQVVSFVQCECPGRSAVNNLGMAIKLAQLKPDEVYLSSCLVNAKPGCPYFTPGDLAAVITEKTGIPVKLGTHHYD